MEKYILITGASGSIGKATAILLSKKYPLILSGRNLERLKNTRAACENSDNHILWQYDLADVKNIGDNLSALISTNNLLIGGFVHVAGIAPLSPLRMLSFENMQEIMAVNFFSAAEILKVLINKKINSKNLGEVVFISSTLSQIGAKGQSVYCASKAALEGFARAMAVELAPIVRVNAICPGGILTEIGELITQNEELLKNPVDESYLLGLGQPEDIANMVEFLISSKAKWITGQVFNVDGGRSAN